MPSLRRLRPKISELEHQRLLTLINSMADGVITLDEHFRVALYNASALSILDLNATIQNQPLANLVKIYTSVNEPVDLNQLIVTAKTPISSRDYLLHYNDSSMANLYLSVAPVHLGYGQAGQKGFVLVLRDITKEKSVEAERDEFISVVSHELRTPITIAEGNVSNAQLLLERSGDMNEIKQALVQTHSQIVFLADLINDLATLSRAERGRLTIDVSAINAHELIDELVRNYGPEIKAKKLELKIDLDPHLELLYSSELYVKEILQNFITNAIKYTSEGSVTIGAKAISGAVEFSVSDTGIGISKSDQEKIFQKFYRSEDYRTRETKGTGLGLYVTKKLAALINAKITLESELNHGSTIKILVPNLPKGNG
jgi:two-component system phosphate regulon sensor histidine kinase PhoR